MSSPPPSVAAISHGGAAWSTASSSVGQGQQPFGRLDGPRPPGVRDGKSPLALVGAAGAEQNGQIIDNPRPEAGGAFGEAPRSAGASAFGEASSEALGNSETSGASEPPRNGPPMNGAASPPDAGAAAVAKRLLTRGGGNGSTAKGVPHVNSAPSLQVDTLDDTAATKGGDGAAGLSRPARGSSGPTASGVGAGGEGNKERGVEQAPKSEPKQAGKGKTMRRRASVGGATVASKPGRLAKMMSKWLYPDAKVRVFVLGVLSCCWGRVWP